MRRTESPDRHLQKREDGGYRYVRRVPGDALIELRRHDVDYPEIIRRSLDTHERDAARAKRDAMEKADNEYWEIAAAGSVPAQEAYARAVARARSLKVEYRPAGELATTATLDDLLKRLSLVGGPPDQSTAAAVLGVVATPKHTLDQAFDVFEKEIRKQDLGKKSQHQRRKWKELKQRGLANFKREVGDIAVEDISRENANKFYKFWLDRIAPQDEEAEPTHSPSAGNKDLDTMRSLCGEFYAHLGREDLTNPFRGLRFSDDDGKTRPGFSRTWIETKILAAGALDTMNEEAVNAVLILINTGARPSEIVNLQPDAIMLDGPIPYVDIKAVVRGAERRELKNKATVRRIPLLGRSLEAMKKQLKGFPSYRDNDNLSAAVNKFFRENGLAETEKHTLYSFRHGFEARLKLAGVDEELRRYLMGHSIKRPKYGYSEDLSWSLSAIEKVAL